MKIREELKEKGFSNSEINIFLKNEYDRQKQKLDQEKIVLLELKKQLKNSHLEKHIDKLIDIIKNKHLLDGKKDLENSESIEFYKYCSNHNIKPTEIIKNADNTTTYLYKQENRIVKINLEMNLASISFLSKEEDEKFKLNNKRLLAEVLPVSEEKIIDMSEKQILKLVSKNERQQKRKTKNI